MAGDARSVGERLAGIEQALRAVRRDCDAASGRPAPTIHTRSMGNLANRMIQYMAAVSLQARIPGAAVASIQLPEWGIETPTPPVEEPALRIPTERIDFSWIADRVREGGFGDIVLLQYLQHVENLLPPDVFRPVFAPRAAPVRAFGDDVLVISLRMKEVLSGFYPLYTLLPVPFYRDVVRATGLRPVFFGQLTPCAYLDQLRSAFPDAEFVPGVSAMEDFETLRQAANVCVSISTFAWVAAWLGRARRIVLPLSGLLSPASCACLGGDLDLVPRRDPRMDAWVFPVNFAVEEARIADAHRALDGRWRRLSADALDLFSRAGRRRDRIRDEYDALFDPAFYLEAHPEVASAVREGRLASAAEHYRLHGFDENRACFRLDPAWYATAYPEAADAVGAGLYRDFHHFQAACGQGRPAVAPPGRDGALAA